MHLLPRETLTLDAAEQAVDLGHAPADVVLLSFTDSDLSAAAAAWASLPEPRFSLRLASLARLRHPMSVDLYVEEVLARSRCVVIRLLGGLDYWRYGAEEVAALCRRHGIPLALLPGESLADARLAELSTMPAPTLARLERCFRHGGAAHLATALRLAAQEAGLDTAPAADPDPLPAFGSHDFGLLAGGPAAAIVFYRSHLLAGDIAPVQQLAKALSARGLTPYGLFAASLKDDAASRFIADALGEMRPAVVLNATAFSPARQDVSPLDAAGVPVLQLVLSGSSRAVWAASTRGLSQSDLAMQVVLPELDGRLPTTAIGFKAEEDPLPGLEFRPTRLRPDLGGIALAADRAAGWARLRATPAAARRVAILLSDYPARDGRRAGGARGRAGFLRQPGSAARRPARRRLRGGRGDDGPCPGGRAGQRGAGALPGLAGLRCDVRDLAAFPAAGGAGRLGCAGSRPGLHRTGFRAAPPAKRRIAAGGAAGTWCGAPTNAPATTTPTCRPAMPTWPSTCGCGRATARMRCCISARTARWNGCRARPPPSPIPARPPRSRAACR